MASIHKNFKNVNNMVTINYDTNGNSVTHRNICIAYSLEIRTM